MEVIPRVNESITEEAENTNPNIQEEVSQRVTEPKDGLKTREVDSDEEVEEQTSEAE